MSELNIKKYESGIYKITQGQMNKFGEVTAGDGKIHTDPEFAKNTRFKKTLVQGVYLLAIVEKELDVFFQKWGQRGVLEATFLKPITVDEEFKVCIEQTDVENDYKVTVVNSKGEEAVAIKCTC